MSDNEKKTAEFVEKYAKQGTGLYYLWRTIAYIPAYLGYRPKFIGRKNIPDKGGIILASNHIHLPDSLFVMLSTKRAVRYLAKKELHDSALGFIFRSAATIPVDRQHGAHNSMVAAEKALGEGEVIGIFPEGTRNRKGEQELLPFKIGAVRMARDTGCAIVPIAYTSKGRPFLDPYRVVIGEAYYVDKDADLDKENEILRNKIADLLKVCKDDTKW